MSNLPPPPKAPCQPRVLYTSDAEVRAAYLKEHPSAANTEIVSGLSAKWKELDEATRKIYEDRAAEQNARYEQEMAEYKSKYGDDAPTIYRRARRQAKPHQTVQKGSYRDLARVGTVLLSITDDVHQKESGNKGLQAFATFMLMRRFLGGKFDIDGAASELDLRWDAISQRYSGLEQENTQLYESLAQSLEPV